VGANGADMEGGISTVMVIIPTVDTGDLPSPWSQLDVGELVGIS